jgi:hypothetical protein
MEALKIEGEYGWVIKVLESCETVDQIRVSQTVFEIFIKKWDKTLSLERKLRLQNNFDKLKWVQSRKIKKKLVN